MIQRLGMTGCWNGSGWMVERVWVIGRCCGCRVCINWWLIDIATIWYCIRRVLSILINIIGSEFLWTVSVIVWCIVFSIWTIFCYNLLFCWWIQFNQGTPNRSHNDSLFNIVEFLSYTRAMDSISSQFHMFTIVSVRHFIRIQFPIIIPIIQISIVLYLVIILHRGRLWRIFYMNIMSLLLGVWIRILVIELRVACLRVTVLLIWSLITIDSICVWYNQAWLFHFRCCCSRCIVLTRLCSKNGFLWMKMTFFELIFWAVAFTIKVYLRALYKQWGVFEFVNTCDWQRVLCALHTSQYTVPREQQVRHKR